MEGVLHQHYGKEVSRGASAGESFFWVRLESGLDGTPVYVLGVVTNQQLLQGQPNICGGGGVAMGLHYSFVICMFHQVNNVCF